MTSPGQPSPQAQESAQPAEGGESERALVAAAQQDPANFGALYDQYFDSIYSFVYYRVGRHDTTEDIVGDVFERALRGLPRFRWKAGGFKAWIFRIASNAVTDHHRRRGRRPTAQPYDDLRDYDADGSSLEYDIPQPDETVLREEQRRELLQQVAQLSPAQQEAVILKYLEGMSNQEIAEITGRSATAVSSLLHRAMESLRERLVENDG